MSTLHPPRESRVRAYARLAKLDIFDYYLSLPIVLTLLPLSTLADPNAQGMLALFLVGEIVLMASLVAFDDVTGYLDGSDVVNYGPDAVARRKERKPLVAGTLTVAEARRFAWGAFWAGAALWAVAVYLAPRPSTWGLVLTVVTLICYPQYSYGLRLSYVGLQEFYIAAIGWALLLAPYGLAGGEPTGFVLVQAFLFGLGPLLFGVYSNTNDVRGDRGVGRPTVAALTGPVGNMLFVLGLTAVEAVVIIGASATGVAPWWFAFALAPTILLRAVQCDLGWRRGDILRARKLGIHIHRLTSALLLLVNLVAGLA